MKTRKLTVTELREMVRSIIKEQMERPKQTLKYDGDDIEIYYDDTPGKSYIYAMDAEGEPYIDVSTVLRDNPLVDAVWVKKGGEEEKIADKLKFIKKSKVMTKSGFATFIKYDVV